MKSVEAEEFNSHDYYDGDVVEFEYEGKIWRAIVKGVPCIEWKGATVPLYFITSKPFKVEEVKDAQIF